MSKFHLLLICFVLLPVGGCGLPSIPNPFMVPCRIVPECSGRITDLNGKPLPGVRVRIFSYDKISTAVSDEQGRFTLSPLYKWVGFQEKYDIYDDNKYTLSTESTAGTRHIIFGELALFFETQKEHFLLLGVNFYPAKFVNNQFHHTIASYTKYMFHLCCPDLRKKNKNVPVLSKEEAKKWSKCGLFAAWEHYQLCRADKLPPNPFDGLSYTLCSRIDWDGAGKRKIQTPHSIVCFDDSFIRWMKNKAVSQKMYETAVKKEKEPKNWPLGVFSAP